MDISFFRKISNSQKNLTPSFFFNFSKSSLRQRIRINKEILWESKGLKFRKSFFEKMGVYFSILNQNFSFYLKKTTTTTKFCSEKFWQIIQVWSGQSWAWSFSSSRTSSYWQKKLLSSKKLLILNSWIKTETYKDGDSARPNTKLKKNTRIENKFYQKSLWNLNFFFNENFYDKNLFQDKIFVFKLTIKIRYFLLKKKLTWGRSFPKDQIFWQIAITIWRKRLIIKPQIPTSPVPWSH